MRACQRTNIDFLTDNKKVDTLKAKDPALQGLVTQVNNDTAALSPKAFATVSKTIGGIRRRKSGALDTLNCLI